MAENKVKKTATKAGISLPTRPKDAKSTESQYSYYARKYMEAQDDPQSATKKDKRSMTLGDETSINNG